MNKYIIIKNKILFCKDTKGCNYTSGYGSGKITLNKHNNYFCDKLKDEGICTYLIELENQKRIADSLETLIKYLKKLKS